MNAQYAFHSSGMARRVLEERINPKTRQRELRVVYHQWSHLAYQAHNNLRLAAIKAGRAKPSLTQKLK